MREIEDARRGLLQELAAAVAEELVEADLELESGVAVSAVHGEVIRRDEGDEFVRG